jgi:hypothetical protein
LRNFDLYIGRVVSPWWFLAALITIPPRTNQVKKGM